MTTPQQYHPPDLSDLASTIEEAFPELAGFIAPLTVLGQGYDSFAVETSSGLVFRIPKREDVARKQLVQGMAAGSRPASRGWLTDRSIYPTGGMVRYRARQALTKGRGQAFLRNTWYVAAWSEEVFSRPVGQEDLGDFVARRLSEQQARGSRLWATR